MHAVLQKIVFPSSEHHDRLPLYLAVDEIPGNESVDAPEVIDRYSIRLPAGARVSFATYFNAVPSSYWRHWTAVRQLTLEVSVSGNMSIHLRHSDASGSTRETGRREVNSTSVMNEVIEADISDDDEGGWVWFDLAAGEGGAVLHGAAWSTQTAPVRDGRISIGITTHNKPDYCVRTLALLSQMDDLDTLLDRILIVDQGDKAVRDEPGFTDAANSLLDHLSVIEQDNLGGSGGFSRAMIEALQRPESTGVLLLDDDVSIDPEGIRRAIIFSRFTLAPAIVGGHMFDLRRPTRLHALAEVVDTRPFGWRPVHEDAMPHDFATHGLRGTPLLHHRYDTDFNGWWMCLIPSAVIEQIGLAIPAFIKWDDAEYGLRASAAGVSTVSLPGAALWHVVWTDKDDLTDWQAYFHARNRIVTALLHSSEPHGGDLLTHSRRMDLKHLMSMQYYAVELRHQALRDVLSGPDGMPASLRSALAAARAMGTRHPEAARGGPIEPAAITSADFAPVAPTGWKLRWMTLAALIRHWFRPSRRGGHGSAALPREANAWWILHQYDSACVVTADGDGSTKYVRDRRAHRRLLVESVRLHRQLHREWGTLSQAYRAALPALTSPETWESIFKSRSAG